MALETTITTVTEMIPTIVSNSLLEVEEGDVVLPLVTVMPFPGQGVVHSTPIISKLASEADDSLSNQAIDSGTYTGSPSQATVGVHGITVFLKELAVIASVGDLYAIAGQLIGQAVATRRDTDLVTLFSSITAIEGDANEDIVPADFFSAFNKLRIQNAPLPYYMVLHPGHIWSSIGITAAFANVADANHYSYAAAGGVGSVGEDIMRNGFAGKMFGFDIFSDSNIPVTSRSGSGCAFSRQVIKYTPKREFRVDVLYNGPEVGWQVSGTEMWGEAILKNNFGVEMQFNTSP